MIKTQNTKNEQQKDLCITSEQLTEQYQKGELPDGNYWVMLDVYEDGEPELSDVQISDGSPVGWYDESVKEVLAPVPSYEEWQAKDDALTALLVKYGELTKELQNEKEKYMTRLSLRLPTDEIVIEKQVWASTLHRSMLLQAENTKLKELLKECKDVAEFTKTIVNKHKWLDDVITKINQALGEDK